MNKTQIKAISKKLTNVAIMYSLLIIAAAVALKSWLGSPIDSLILFCGGIVLTLMITIHLIQIVLTQLSSSSNE
jgi:hypothetical protein